MWINYEKDWANFEIDGLNRPNTLVHLREENLDQIEFLGTLTTEGGGCDCCGYSWSAIVVKYKYLGEIEELNGRP